MQNVISHIDVHDKKVAITPETDDGNDGVNKSKNSKINPCESITGRSHDSNHTANEMHHVMHAIHFKNTKQQAILGKRR